MVCIPLAIAACVFLFMIHQSFPAENFFGSTAYAVIYPEQPFYGLTSRMLFFVTAALASLGYSQQEIAAALKGVDVNAMRVEEIVRQALRAMVMQ